MTDLQALADRLREWAKDIRAEEGSIYPEIDLDTLQYDLDHVASVLEEITR